MTILSITFAMITLAISIFFAFKKKNDAKKCISAITLGILFTTFFLVLPTEWVKAGKDIHSPLLYSILSSLLYSFKALGGRQDIAQLETVLLTGFPKTLYICINYLMFALAPILASSLVLSFIGDTGEKIRYFFSWSPKCHIFSEINQSSISLANGIKNTEGKKTIVFCNTKNADKDLLAEAKKLGGITLYKSCKNIKLFWRNTKYEFYFLSENEDHNIELTGNIIAQKDKLPQNNVTINSFVQNSDYIELMESTMTKKNCAIFESTDKELIKKAIELIHHSPNTKLIFFNASDTDEAFRLFLEKYSSKSEKNLIETYPSDWKTTELDDRFSTYDITLYYLEDKDEVSTLGLGYRKNHLVTEWQEQPLKIRFIDEIALFCNNLIFKHPLYKLPNGRKDISVLLVGCGRLGTQMLKTVAWCGQIKGYTLKIRVLDKNAKSIEKEFFARHPEMKYYDIEFENVDVESIEFENAINQHSDATFVCVATGSDDLNISTAENIFRILRRNYTGYTPPIFTRVRKNIKSKNYEDKSSFLTDRKIHLFGTIENIFSNDTLFNSEFESLAFAVHLCYNGALTSPKSSFEYQKALNDFYTSEYSRKSSMAAALHIPYKLKRCDIHTEGALPTQADIAKFEKAMHNEELKQLLIENEHERWNAFMRSEGFRTVDFETVKKYAPETKSHKDESAKLHPCILDWNELDLLQDQYNQLQQELHLKESDFKKYDKKIVIKIPEIIKRATELCKEGW